MKYTDVMIDLETFGTNANAAILSIGLVMFNRTSEETKEEHLFISADSVKGEVDVPTIIWWLGQSREAQGALIEGMRTGLTEAAACHRLEALFQDYSDPARVRVWGNGASFDITLLESMFKRNKRPVPWRFYNVRCYRTLKSEMKHIDPPRVNGLAHDALHDARFQTDHLKSLLGLR